MRCRPMLGVLLLLCGVAFASCSKKKGAGAAGPGAGGGWVVGENGMLLNVHADGRVTDHELAIDDDLLDVACRGADSAFIAGERGTLLRTFDGGEEWESVDVGTRAALRSVAAAARDYVVAGGDDGLFTSANSGTTWSRVASGAFVSVAIDHSGDVIMALDRAGTVWREDRASTLRPLFSVAGATSLHMSHGGDEAVLLAAGGALWSTSDGGGTWFPLDLGGAFELHGAWVGNDGAIVGVGGDGVIVRVAAGRASAQQVGSGRLETVHINSQGVGYAGGGTELLQTLDGGASWRVVEASSATPRGRVYGIGQLDPSGYY